MDWVGNYGHEVALPYNYVAKREWHEHFRDTNLSLEHWTEARIVAVSVLADLWPPASLYRTFNDLVTWQRTFRRTSRMPHRPLRSRRCSWDDSVGPKPVQVNPNGNQHQHE
jgi:hypothetical protein